MKKAFNKQRIIILLNVKFIILIKSNRLLLANISSSIINRFQRPHFIVIIMRIFIIFIKLITLIIKFIIIFFSSIFSKFIKIKIMRKHFEYKII